MTVDLADLPLSNGKGIASCEQSFSFGTCHMYPHANARQEKYSF